MMGRAFQLPKLKGTPEWLFHWRGISGPLIPKLLALALIIGLFTFLLSLKIRLKLPEKTIPRKASVIYLSDDAQGRALTLRAREGGPFPSRFEPVNWQGLSALELAGMDAARLLPKVYSPEMRDLPDSNQLRPFTLVVQGESFFPMRPKPQNAGPEPVKLKLAPVLYPLAGISQENLPRQLTPLNLPIDSKISSISWRFLLRLNADGVVGECISLEKGDEKAAAELEAWLKRIQFQPDPAQPSRWISLGLGFTNQPAE